MKKYNQLNREQRYELFRLRATKKHSVAQIAEIMGVHKSTVYRELKRHGGRRGGYDPALAHSLALDKRRRRPGNRAVSPDVWREVERLIRERQWSPEQVSGWMRENLGVRISHETIYRRVRRDKPAGGDLWKHCRHRLKKRRRPVGGGGPIPNRRGIEERPGEAAEAAEIGHFEMDTIVGARGRGAILTMVDRKTGYLLMRLLPGGKEAAGAASAAVRLLMPFRRDVRTITTDNGGEFAAHAEITRRIRAPVFFAHPYSSWEKGLIEYTNKLIRQYIPKNTDFGGLTDEFVLSVQHKINKRPRKKLNFKTPLECFYKNLT